MSAVAPLPPRELPEPRHWRMVLSRPEAATLALVALGWSNREAALGLCVTEQTVKWRLAAVYEKLNVRNRVEAARWWWEHVERPARERMTD